MKEKFTNWMCKESEVGAWYNIEDENGQEVCTVYGYDPDNTGSNVSAEAHISAHLIAAAPKMYAMLGFILSELKGAEETIAWDDVEKLLAEARGEL